MAATKNAKKKSPPTQAPRPYVFAVVALAVFLLGIMFWRTPIKGYAVAAKISLPESGETAAEALRDEMMEVGHLRRALKQVGPDPTWGAGSEEDFPLETDVQRVWDDLRTVVLEKQGKQKTAALQIIHIGMDRRWSLALVDRLVHQMETNYLAADHSEADQRAAAEMENMLVEAQREEMQSQEMLDALLKKHFEALKNRRIETEPSENSRDFPDDGSSFQPRRENADWVVMQQTLNDLQDRREQLINSRTPEHPDVLALNEKIEKQQAALEQTPRYLEAPARDELPEISLDSKEKQTSPGDAEVLAATAQYEKLQKQHATVRQRRLETEAALQQARLQLHSPQSKTLIEITEPARVIQRIGGSPSLSRVATLAMLATLAGGLLAWLSGGKRADALASLDEVRQQLTLPVVAALSAPHGPTLTKQHPLRRRMVRFATLGCEAVLTLTVFGFLFLALLDSSLMVQFVDDPFATFGEAASRMTRRPF